MNAQEIIEVIIAKGDTGGDLGMVLSILEDDEFWEYRTSLGINNANWEAVNEARRLICNKIEEQRPKISGEKLSDYIRANYVSAADFARDCGVLPQQVTKWLAMRCVVIDGFLYSPRRSVPDPTWVG